MLMKVMEDRITINDQTLFVGQRYYIKSVLDSPYKYMDVDIKEKRHINEKNVYEYIGILKQVPYMRDNTLVGHELYFKVEDINYHEDFQNAEKLELIMNGAVTIKAVDDDFMLERDKQNYGK